jgi:hypothetical protein
MSTCTVLGCAGTVVSLDILGRPACGVHHNVPAPAWPPCPDCGGDIGHTSDLLGIGIHDVSGRCGAKEPGRVYTCWRPKGHSCEHVHVKSNWPA